MLVDGEGEGARGGTLFHWTCGAGCDDTDEPYKDDVVGCRGGSPPLEGVVESERL